MIQKNLQKTSKEGREKKSKNRERGRFSSIFWFIFRTRASVCSVGAAVNRSCVIASSSGGSCVLGFSGAGGSWVLGFSGAGGSWVLGFSSAGGSWVLGFSGAGGSWVLGFSGAGGSWVL